MKITSEWLRTKRLEEFISWFELQDCDDVRMLIKRLIAPNRRWALRLIATCLSSHSNIRLASYAIKKAIHIFEAAHPNDALLRQVLERIDAWCDDTSEQHATAVRMIGADIARALSDEWRWQSAFLLEIAWGVESIATAVGDVDNIPFRKEVLANVRRVAADRSTGDGIDAKFADVIANAKAHVVSAENAAVDAAVKAFDVVDNLIEDAYSDEEHEYTIDGLGNDDIITYGLTLLEDEK